MATTSGIARFIMRQMLGHWIERGLSSGSIIEALKDRVYAETGFRRAYRRTIMLGDIREFRGVDKLGPVWAGIRHEYIPGIASFVQPEWKMPREYLYKIQLTGIDAEGLATVHTAKIWTDLRGSVNDTVGRYLGDPETENRSPWVTEADWSSWKVIELYRRPD